MCHAFRPSEFSSSILLISQKGRHLFVGGKPIMNYEEIKTSKQKVVIHLCEGVIRLEAQGT
jgi:hypothetical protein